MIFPPTSGGVPNATPSSQAFFAASFYPLRKIGK
jgi:hypothetical protein